MIFTKLTFIACVVAPFSAGIRLKHETKRASPLPDQSGTSASATPASGTPASGTLASSTSSASAALSLPSGLRLLDRRNRNSSQKPSWQEIEREVEAGIAAAYKPLGGHPALGQLADFYPYWALYIDKGHVKVAVLGWTANENLDFPNAKNVKMGAGFSYAGDPDLKAKWKKSFMSLVSLLMSRSGWWAECSPPVFWSLMKLSTPVVYQTSVAKALVNSVEGLRPCSKEFMGDFYDSESLSFRACFSRVIGNEEHEKALIGCPPPFEVRPTVQKSPFTGEPIQACLWPSNSSRV